MSQLKRSLTLSGLTMVAIGSCIGSGIFLTPSEIAAQLGSPLWILLVWGLGGVVALTGALTFTELGGLFPGSGGVYVYLKEAYGPLVAFLYGWSIFAVITSGAIAALALAFARYLDFLVPLGPYGIRLTGIAAIVLVTVVNVRGVKLGEWFAKVFTSMKLLGIGFIVLVAGVVFFSGGAGFSLNAPSLPGNTSFALALIGVLWSYGGWHHASYLAGETPNADRVVPRAMLIGAAVVTLTYLLTNLAYLFLLPVGELATSAAVAADAIGRVFSWGGVFVALLIALSTFGTAGIYTLSAPRIYFSMARDGVFFPGIARVHPKWQTPARAIVLQSAWAIVLLLFWGTFENLITYVVFMDWIFMTLAAGSVILFRRRLPDLHRPVRVFAYPWPPLVFMAISLWFLAYTLIGKPAQTWSGLFLVGSGILLYRFFRADRTGRGN